MKITVLGSGTSHGVPVIGCSCPVCRSTDSRDARMRSSLFITGEAGERAVIDTGPEFRLQALRAGIDRLDAVFFTHAHADHIHGLDDVRPLSREKIIPLYGNEETIAEFKERFSYIFRHTQRGGGKPNIDALVLNGELSLGKLRWTPIPVGHGELKIYGWKVVEDAASGPSLVYLTDTSCIPEKSFRLIGRPALLIIGALRKRPHATHFMLDQALEAAFRIGAGQTYFTHICHDHSHKEIGAYCEAARKKAGFPRPPGGGPGIIGPAWDGLEISL